MRDASLDTLRCVFALRQSRTSIFILCTCQSKGYSNARRAATANAAFTSVGRCCFQPRHLPAELVRVADGGDHPVQGEIERSLLPRQTLFAVPPSRARHRTRPALGNVSHPARRALHVYVHRNSCQARSLPQEGFRASNMVTTQLRSSQGKWLNLNR